MEPERESAPGGADEVRATLRTLIAEACGIAAEELDDGRPLMEYGLGSRAAVGLTGRLERALGRPLSATLLWEQPTVERLVRHLSGTPQRASEARPERREHAAPHGAQETPASTTGADGDAHVTAASTTGADRDGPVPGVCPIAVIGIGCRLPGGVNGPEGFFKRLLSGSDLVGHVPGRRRRYFATATGAPAEQAIRHGAFLDDVEAFDAGHFGITPREADVMDPQQRLLLEVASEALDHAGRPAYSLEGSDTGVFVGISAVEYGQLTTADPARLTPWTSTGAAGSIIANRLSYVFDLHGPSLTIDTACSSSLVAVHQACRSLGSGECDTALAAGVNVLLSPVVTASMGQMGALSADGRCKPFDALANGIARGEGCGVVVLKRLADAQRDGDRILAVIKGTAVNSDGRSAGLMAPNPAAQERLLRSALGNAQLDATDIDYVEAHGTGTLLGDPMEAASLGAVLGQGRPADQPLLIGSVKSNLGHLEGAAGIVGLIKTVLALHHRRIPHSLHFHTPNPHIDFRALGLCVVTEPTDWPRRGRPPRAGVSAFGFGGTNAHVVLEDAPASPPADDLPASGDTRAEGPHALVVSARSPQRIGDVATALARRLAVDDPPPLKDLTHTLARHRRGPACAAVVARTHQEAADRLAALARDEEVPGLLPPCTDNHAGRSSGSHRPVFVFSGHGSQWQGMGLRLLQDDPFFAAAVDELDGAYREQAGVPLRDMFSRLDPGSGFEYLQPALFGMHIALARTLQAYGVHPAAVIGHSMGEVSAAVIAGALDPADGLHVVLSRSAALATLDTEATGAMAAVELADEDRAEVLSRFPGVEIAVDSSPRRCTVAGPAHTVRQLVDTLSADGRFARLLDIGAAAHSPAVDRLLPRVRQSLDGLGPRPAGIAWYSTVLDDPRAGVTADAAYWCANLRRPVRLHQAVAAAAADGHAIFLEVSPHPIAHIPLGETLQTVVNASAALAIPTLRKQGDEAVDLRTALTRLHLAGAPVEENRLWPRGRRIPLPSPVWRHERHWFGHRGPATGGGASRTALGRRIDDPRSGAVLWQTDLGTGHARAAGRQLHGRLVLDLPAAAALMITAAQDIHGRDCTDGLHIEELAVHRWLPLASSTPVTLTWEPMDSHAAVAVNARSADGTWHCYASARMHTDLGPFKDATPDTPPAVVTHWSPATPEESRPRSYEELLTALLYAPAESGAVTSASDATSDDSRTENVPALVRSLRLENLTDVGTSYTVQAFPESGDQGPGWTVVAGTEPSRITATGLQFGPASRYDVPKPLEALTYEIEWQKSPVPLPGRLGSALLLVDEPAAGTDGTLATALGAALEARNVSATTEAVVGPDAGQPLGDWLQRTAPEEPRAVVLLLTRPAGTHDLTALHTAAQVARRLASRPSGVQPPRLWLVTERSRCAAPGEPGRPDLACLRGLVRTLAIEEPALRACLLDIDAHPEAVDNLVQELLGDSTEDEVVWRAGTRLVARLTSADLSGQQYEAPFVRRNGAYVVTGGLGGLGLETARRLAEQGAGRLVLNGRRPPAPETEAVITRLVARGTSVAVVQGDIADPGVAERLVLAAVSEGHILRGVAHCAGVLHDRMITDLETTDLDTVLRPKVVGALNLEAALTDHDIDWWVFYSSAAALLGSPGQTAHASANAWLDAMAQRRRAEGQPATSIAWGPWRDAGAVADHRGLALDFLTVEEGLDALQTLVAHNRTHTGVVHLDAPRLLEAFPGFSGIPFFSHSLRTADLSPDDWRGPAGIDSLGAAAADKVLQRLAGRAAAIMGFGASSLDEAVPLPRLGLDSLMAVRIRNAVQQDFAVDLPPDLMLRGATLRDVGDAVLRALGLRREAADTAAPQGRLDAAETTEAEAEAEADTAEADAAGRTTPPGTPSGTLPSTIQPRDAAERLVAGAWAEVLRQPPTDVRADFVAAGGDQRAAEELVGTVRHRLGGVRLDLTASAVLEQRTVAAIAELIRPAVNPAGEQVVNVLRPHRAGSPTLPLFTFHPGGGPTSVYQPLTQLLPSDQAVYGMERLDALGTMEEKAAHYITLIKKLQPQGPYRLLGWSFGGFLAYETAQQLTDAGDTIDFLGLIDTLLPTPLPDVDSSQVLLERFGRFAEYISKTYGHRVELPYEELAVTPAEEQIDVVMRLVAESGLDMSPGIMEHQRTSYIDALVGERYRPRPYHGRVVLYRARQANHLITALDPRYLRTEADLGWALLCPSLEVVPVDGDHLSLIDPPHVTTIADHLGHSFGA
ncbi:type I polyketide synthase [Streptomyces cyanogenus]|uniref:Phthiocerol synthesis polyketide synthase type I PpsC n=1 Tax=Streptomyces cyanogenus TaxID=80860 RepID=A0ABX7U2M1_STRCY|nr:type I polyketide synthase [Streptomyces cyanogenus]QTE02997.1 Phthiocerol synthesis polyketide synthase type I PpsC [Streptomyces cyanogenus]